MTHNLNSKNPFTFPSWFLLLGGLLSCIVVLISEPFSFNKYIFVALLTIPTSILFFWQPNYILNFILIALHISMGLLDYQIVTITSVLLLPIILFNLKKIEHIPVFLILFLFLLGTIPSHINNPNMMKSLFYYGNIISGFIFALGISLMSFTKRTIVYPIVVYLTLSFINGFVIIYHGIPEKRFFGFTGIVYVDLVCISIILSAFLTIITNKKKLFGCLCIFFLIALFFTQTRNTLVSLMLAFLVLSFVLFFNLQKLNISRVKYLKVVSSVVLIPIVVVTITFLFSPNLFKRHTSLLKTENFVVNSQENIANNTIITRFLLWQTGTNAFLEHPFVGVGFYSFTFNSQNYFNIPLFLYKKFVHELSPHVTYLTALIETGILGFSFFIFFLASVLFFSYKAMQISQTQKEFLTSFGLFSGHIYIYCSMLMSDAWFWGQCLAIWFILIGFTIKNYTWLKAKNMQPHLF